MVSLAGLPTRLSHVTNSYAMLYPYSLGCRRGMRGYRVSNGTNGASQPPTPTFTLTLTAIKRSRRCIWPCCSPALCEGSYGVDPTTILPPQQCHRLLKVGRIVSRNCTRTTSKAVSVDPLACASPRLANARAMHHQLRLSILDPQNSFELHRHV
jgi:hypothetical protein